MHVDAAVLHAGMDGLADVAVEAAQDLVAAIEQRRLDAEGR